MGAWKVGFHHDRSVAGAAGLPRPTGMDNRDEGELVVPCALPHESPGCPPRRGCVQPVGVHRSGANPGPPRGDAQSRTVPETVRTYHRPVACSYTARSQMRSPS